MDIRNQILTEIEKQAPSGASDQSLQSNLILDAVSRTLNAQHDHRLQQAILTQWHDLFRTGYLAWGYNLANPNPPFFHLTQQGRTAIENVGRDPGNPTAYLRYVYSLAELNPIAKSYLEEGVSCYVNGLYKSAAVMVGAAAESLINELRDTVRTRLEEAGKKVSRNLTTWKVKDTLSGLKAVFDENKLEIPYELKEAYESYWPAFTQQIRTARNEAGHPQSIDPITPEIVHGSLLIFPELAKLADNLKQWAESNV